MELVIQPVSKDPEISCTTVMDDEASSLEPMGLISALNKQTKNDLIGRFLHRIHKVDFTNYM